MYFGLYNSPGTFQRMMNSIFQELLHEGVLANYIDKFLILAKTKKELKERTICFLKVAEKHNLCFKQSKCNFDTKKIPILEVVVGQGEVQMENNKIKAVKEWKTPTKIKKKSGKFLRICKFLPILYQELQPHGKTSYKLKGKKKWK